MASILLSIAVSAAMSFVARMFQPAQEGPRLTDLKLHGSSYGVMNPLLWGTMRVPGNVIDETDLVEHKHSSGGKGGGPQVNTYTYTVSVAIRLCDVEVTDVSKIWANGRLIYGGDADSEVPVVFYLGTEDQLPDPTFETVHGVGNVPAYRGVCYAVFTDWDLTEFGNTLPNLNFEVKTAGKVGLTRYATWPVGGAEVDSNTYAYPFQLNGLFLNGTVLTRIRQSAQNPSLSAGYFHYQKETLDLQGNKLSDTGVLSVALPWASSSPSTIAFKGAMNCGIAYAAVGVTRYWCGAVSADEKIVPAWYVDGVLAWTPTELELCGSGYDDFDMQISDGLWYSKGYVYAIGRSYTTSPHWIRRWPAPNGIPISNLYDKQYVFDFAEDISGQDITADAQGNIYVLAIKSLQNPDLLYKFDAELNLVWLIDPLPSDVTTNPGYSSFIVNGNNIIFSAFEGLPFVHWYRISGTTLTSVDRAELDFPYHTAIRLSSRFFATPEAIWDMGGDEGVTLSSIVADISERAGLDASEYDVTALTDIVAGYLVTQQGSARTMLQPLRDTYFVDAVERDDVVVFVKRGGASVVTIPDDDLAAHLDGETLPPILTTTRTQEVDLPATFNVDYVNAAADYQTGTQRARRLVTQSQSEMKIELPVSLTDAQAKAIADTHLYEAWQERQRYSIQTSRKYAKYEPTDIITAGGQDICIRQKHEVRGGVIKFDGVSVLSSVYTAGGGAVATKGFRTSGTSSTAFTKALLLDLPLINDGDDPNGFYVAMAGGDGAWPGASLMKSADGGATYSSVVSTATASVTGTTSDVLGVYLGGNTFDELNTVTVVTTGGELSSTTETAVLNGANVAVIGAEIIQFKNAVLTDTNTYVLSGLLRGRRGTEWAMSHLAGENFALLPTADAEAPSVDLIRERLYKPVTFGKTLASTTAMPFTNSGNRLKPYSPVHAGGGIDAAGNVTLQCTRRTRIGGNWVDFSDVPVSETTNRFIWQIWDSSYSQCARIIDASYAMDVSRPTASYSVADITTDFGAPQQTYFVTVAQVGAVGIGRQTQFTVPGSGGSNNAPLSPITPYNNPIVPPPTAGSCAPAGTVITTPLSWTTPITVYSGTFTTSDVWVLPFTTGSSVAGRGYFGAAEYGGSPITRSAYVALSPCGTALKSAGGTSINFSFCGSPNPDPASFLELRPNTTYYVMVETTGNGPMVANLFPNR